MGFVDSVLLSGGYQQAASILMRLYGSCRTMSTVRNYHNRRGSRIHGILYSTVQRIVVSVSEMFRSEGILP